MKLLLIEQISALCEPMVDQLTADGFSCYSASGTDMASDMLFDQVFACVIIGSSISVYDSLWLIEEVNCTQQDACIIVISGQATIEERLKILGSEVDAQLNAPVHPLELMARVNTLLHRHKPPGKGVVAIGDLRLDIDTRRAWVADDELRLTRTEFELLAYMLKNQGHILSKEMIIRHVWEDGSAKDEGSVPLYVHIRNLRKKITRYTGVEYIRNIYGSGYLLNASA